jgi:hypothetical protein
MDIVVPPQNPDGRRFAWTGILLAEELAPRPRGQGFRSIGGRESQLPISVAF